MQITTRTVTKDNVETAIDIGVKIFGEPDRDGITKEFRAAAEVQPEKDLAEQDLGMVDLHYYIFAKDGTDIGIIGHNKVKGHDDDAWLGWFGILPEYRGGGMAKIVVNQMYDIAAAQPGVKTVRFYVTTEPEYQIAYKMYERMGFKTEPYRPDAKDAASMVTVFSKAVSPEYQGEEYSWKNCAYPMMDFDKYVIPYMNKKYGLDQADRDPPLPASGSTPAGPAPAPQP